MTDRDCPLCGAYASRCHEDRDDGHTYCAATGTRLAAKPIPVGDWWRLQPGAYRRGHAAFNIGEGYSASPYKGAHVDHRASWAAGWLEARQTACDNLRGLVNIAARHDAALAARLMEVIDQFDPSTQ